MAWRVTLALLLVCVGSVCVCVRPDEPSRVVMPRDYGVKLCGREFIRAVIFTCGGSRWKRTLLEDYDPLNRESESIDTENQHTWQDVIELPSSADNRSPLHTSSSSSLADILSVFHVLGDSSQGPQGDFQGSSILVDWPKTNRRKRNFSLGVAGMCCNQGCTKHDIGRLC